MSQADQKIVFIDACHSGLAAQGSNNVFDFEPVMGTFTLASTSADDSSYFKKDAPATYFTTFLTDAFKNGITNSNRMLSLTDLYNYTSQKLSKLRLPAPVCKAQLKNIAADNFYISGNPSFSVEARLGMPRQLYQQGKIEEARREFIRLEKEFPDNKQLQQDHIEFEINAEFNRLVKEGDSLFFRDKDFKAAQSKYKEALNIKYDENIRDKITDCENSLRQQEQPQQQKHISGTTLSKEPENRSVPVLSKPNPWSGPVKKKSILSIRIGVITVVALAILFYFLTRPAKRILYDNDGYNTRFEYRGDLKDEKPDGEGTAKFNNGSEYEGEWVNGLREGKGVFKWANGNVYDGYFKNNALNGTGTIRYKAGGVYEGGWLDNYWHGWGKYTDKDGNVYEGNYKNGFMDGGGTFAWVNGDKYAGNFSRGTRNGFGIYTSSKFFITNCPNCKRYEGQWVSDLKQGHGKCFDGTGVLIYEGEFRNNKPYDPVYPQQ